jgi:hypothetical protein
VFHWKPMSVKSVSLEVRRHWGRSHECALRVRTGGKSASFVGVHTDTAHPYPEYLEYENCSRLKETKYYHLYWPCIYMLWKFALERYQELLHCSYWFFYNRYCVLSISSFEYVSSHMYRTRKRCPSWDSNHTPSAIRTDVLSQLH